MRKARSWTTHEAKKCLADYSAGVPIKDLAARYDTTEAAVTALRLRQGVPAREKGRLLPEEKQRIEALKKFGLTRRAIANHIGRSLRGVHRYLRSTRVQA